MRQAKTVKLLLVAMGLNDRGRKVVPGARETFSLPFSADGEADHPKHLYCLFFPLYLLSQIEILPKVTISHGFLAGPSKTTFHLLFLQTTLMRMT